MDLQTVLAKKAASSTTAKTTSAPTQADAGFFDALSSAANRTTQADTFSALGNMMDRSQAKPDRADEPQERAEKTRSKPTEAKQDKDYDRPETRTARERRDDTVDDKPASNASKRPDKKAKTSANETPKPAEDTKSANASAKAEETNQSVNENADAVVSVAPTTESQTVVAATLQQDAIPAKSADNGQKQAETVVTPEQQEVATATVTAPKQTKNTAPQTPDNTAKQTTTAQATQAEPSKSAADPVAQQQADGIAQRLNKNENIAVSVTKPTNIQQQAAQAQTQQTSQNTGAEKTANTNAEPMQVASTATDGKTTLNTGSNTQQNQNFANTDTQSQSTTGNAQAKATGAQAPTGPSLFQQSMTAQSNAQAAQTGTIASRAAENAAQQSGAQTQAPVEVASTSSASTTTTPSAQPIAPLGTAIGADKAQAAQTPKAVVPKTPVPPKQVVDQVKVNIMKAAKDGADTINIRLRPSELGRVEVKLDIHNDGTVRAMIVADRPETLDVLRRDAAGLDKALQDAGLKPGQDSLNFSLRDEGGQGMANNDNRNKSPYGSLAPDADELATLEENLSAYANTGSADGVDIRV